MRPAYRAGLWMAVAAVLAMTLLGGCTRTIRLPVKRPYAEPPPLTIDTARDYRAVIQTSMGDITVDLFQAESPRTVNNFVFLAREGFFDGLIFHRVVKDFMIQTGDPRGDGTGGPGYTFADELPPQHPYEPGILAMANHGPDTNGSQFFICATGEKCSWLEGSKRYTQFGRVVAGQDVVDAIATVPVQKQQMADEVSFPKKPVYVRSITIVESE